MAANFSMDGQAMVKEEQFRMEEDESANTAFFLDIGQVGSNPCFESWFQAVSSYNVSSSVIGRAEATTLTRYTESRCDSSSNSSYLIESNPYQGH
jgi:hypothetical protein